MVVLRMEEWPAREDRTFVDGSGLPPVIQESERRSSAESEIHRRSAGLFLVVGVEPMIDGGVGRA